MYCLFVFVDEFDTVQFYAYAIEVTSDWNLVSMSMNSARHEKYFSEK